MVKLLSVCIGHTKLLGGWAFNEPRSNCYGVRINYKNESQKTIKYVTFIVSAYNAVNDFIGGERRLQVTGPLPGGREYTNTWDPLWCDKTVVGAKVLRIEIIYTDGTQEVLTGSQVEVANGCYVATAVYGSYDCPQVWTLRRYRDYTLDETWYGRLFIKTYYAISPTLVKWFGHTEWFKKMWKGKLDRMVAKLQSNGVESTPYQDKY